MAGLFIAGALASCNNPSANADYIPTGDLVVVVTDQAAAAVSGASLQVLDANTSFVWAHGVSGSDGVVVFDPPAAGRSVGLLGGSYRASLAPPAGYVVPSSQANPATFQISDKRTTNVTMRVARSP